jgi:hypothetical protein
MMLEVIKQDNSGQTTISVIRKELMIGTKTVWAFMDAQGKYYLNVNQIEVLLELGRYAFLAYLAESGSIVFDQKLRENAGFKNISELRALWNKGLVSDPAVFSVQTETGQIYRAAELDLVTDFIIDQTIKGSKVALILNKALAKESLQIRCESAFVGTSPNILDIIQETNHWITCREVSKSVQATFQNTCMFLKYPVGHTHNRMTKNLFGQTAQQAIANNILVGEDPSVGLDYQKEGEKLILLAKMKVSFTGYRKGTWQDKVDRAYSQLNTKVI